MNRRHQDRQRGLLLGTLVSKVADLEREVRDGRARERDLRERLDAVSSSLGKAWRELEALRPLRWSGVRPPEHLGPMPTRSSNPRLPVEHVSVSEAAKRLDVDGETVRRLVESGALEGEAREVPGRRYRRWSVTARSLDALAADAELRKSTGARTG